MIIGRFRRRQTSPGVAVYFADENSGWVILGNGNSLLTEDGGETWRLQTTTRSTSGLRRITFRSNTEAWALGGRGAYVTEDQGLTWKAVPVDAGDNGGDNRVATGEFNPFLSEGVELASEAPEEMEEAVAEGPELTYDETPRGNPKSAAGAVATSGTACT